MTVPTPTSKYLDITVAPFTENGSPVQTDDQHGESNTYDFDAVNDYLGSNVKPISNGTSKFTISLWIKGDLSNTRALANQRPQSDVAGEVVWYMHIDSSGRLAFNIRESVSGDFLRSTGSEDISNISDFMHFLATADLGAQDVNIYIDGIEIAYNLQDDVVGTMPSTMNPGDLGVASFFNDAFLLGMDGIVSRLKFWDGTILTAAEALEEYNNEVAAIGGAAAPFGVFPRIIPQAIPDALLSRIY